MKTKEVKLRTEDFLMELYFRLTEDHQRPSVILPDFRGVVVFGSDGLFYTLAQHVMIPDTNMPYIQLLVFPGVPTDVPIDWLTEVSNNVNHSYDFASTTHSYKLMAEELTDHLDWVVKMLTTPRAVPRCPDGEKFLDTLWDHYSTYATKKLLLKLYGG